MFRRRKKITNLVTIDDIKHATSTQLKEYFKDDAQENFMRIKNLDNEAREFLRRKITRKSPFLFHRFRESLSKVFLFFCLSIGLVQ